MRVKTVITMIIVLLVLWTPLAVVGVPIPSKQYEIAVTIVAFIRFWLKLAHPPR